MRVKTFRLDDLVTCDAEAARVSHLLAALAGALFHSAGGSREQKNRAVSHHTINVKQHQLDFLRAFRGHGKV